MKRSPTLAARGLPVRRAFEALLDAALDQPMPTPYLRQAITRVVTLTQPKGRKAA